ncbi:42183_t:CDS:2 [Gigaspora margarita]|uniref:42183_t:CDS:1 n=1 Tax=Gigaspora margarita TaxID=4874 RepID=A0ABN7U6S3_GIGMA|nr:42183_t:CDS:2 [Gigaspora margarita]
MAAAKWRSCELCTQYGRNQAARKFKLDSSMVGHQVKVSENWTEETNNRILAVTYTTLQNKIAEILQQPDMALLYGDLAKDFKASHCWLVAFMKRNGLALRCHTKTAQKLSKKSQRMLESFYKVVTELREEKSYELGNIFNMDETLVWFDMVGNFTINPKGKKTVHICTTCNDKNRFMVVLTCAAAPPICIFKGMRLKLGEQIPPGIVVWHQLNSWMDSKLMIKYVKHLDDTRKKDKPKKKPAIAGKTLKGNLCRARISDTCRIVDESGDESDDLGIMDLCDKENTNDENDNKDDDEDDNEDDDKDDDEDDTENDRM